MNFIGDWNGPKSVLTPEEFRLWAFDLLGAMIYEDFESERMTALQSSRNGKH